MGQDSRRGLGDSVDAGLSEIMQCCFPADQQGLGSRAGFKRGKGQTYPKAGSSYPGGRQQIPKLEVWTLIIIITILAGIIVIITIIGITF